MSEAKVSEAAFRAELEAGGYEVIDVTWDVGHAERAHAHKFSAKLLCVQGSVQICTDAGASTYEPGDQFEMTAGMNHRELVGSQGVRLVVGRKY